MKSIERTDVRDETVSSWGSPFAVLIVLVAVMVEGSALVAMILGRPVFIWNGLQWLPFGAWIIATEAGRAP